VSSRLREAACRRWPYLAILAAVVVADQITKLLVSRFVEPYESHEVIAGLVNLTHVRNRGAVFGFLSDAELPNQALLLALLSVVALGAIATYAARLPSTSRLPQTALALVMGGAIGNLIDRVSLGCVIDFVDVFWARHHWPAFNVADSAITVGVTLLVLDMLRSPEPQARPAEAPSGGRSD
jgi:signal peptidase II